MIVLKHYIRMLKKSTKHTFINLIRYVRGVWTSGRRDVTWLPIDEPFA